MKAHPEENILIIDFGSQYTQLITRRVREARVYSEIRPYTIAIDEIRDCNPSGIILSGGPSSVFEEGAPLPDMRLFELGIPILGICYGLQVLAHFFQGKVIQAHRREYGLAKLHVMDNTELFRKVAQNSQVWMSHGDALLVLPDGFRAIGKTDNSPFAAITHPERKIYAVQFHPEVAHTVEGRQILHNFIFNVCQCKPTWTADAFIERAVMEIRYKVGNGRVLCALSGGVDSAVAAALVNAAVGKQLTCVFVDTGLLRKNEALQVIETFTSYFSRKVIAVNASQQFLEQLASVTDPEKKRSKIGNLFIEIFEKEAANITDVEYLVQGTLYPDVIESVSVNGPSQTIKTHHNVGGLPEKMNLKLIEPLRELFKDEVRDVGEKLNLPGEILGRHPFPGPGLAVRILGEITQERIALLQEVDWIYIEELKNNGWYDQIWQAFAVLLPVKTVGVMGDQRTYENVIGLRAVTSLDGMTADWARIPYDLLAAISNRIINEVRGVNRVVYDISSKPPSTIEWE